MSDGRGERNALDAIASFHYLLSVLFAVVVAISVPLLLGTLVGVSLVGQPGTGTSAVARGPTIEYLRRTAPFPSSGPLLRILEFLRSLVLLSLLLLTAVGLERRLRLAWFATVGLYVLFVWAIWPNWVGVLFGLGVIALAWRERGSLRSDQRLSAEPALLAEAVSQKVDGIREEVTGR